MSSFSINDVVPTIKKEEKQEMEEEMESVHRYLGDELLSKIFGNLPPAFKFDFRCLNKTWHYRVTTRVFPPEKTGFIIRDSMRNSTTFMELSPNGNEIISSRDLNLNLLRTSIKSSCNGLLLTRKRLSGSPSLGSPNGINVLQVVNALTQKSITLPQSSSHKFATKILLWGGIAFVPRTQEFKVVQLITDAIDNIHCEIMTLGSRNRSWRTIGPIPGDRLLNDHPVSLNGFLYFMVFTRSYLITIDAGAETMYQTQIPHQIETCYLLQMGGDHVALIERTYHDNLSVWILLNSRRSQWGKGWCPTIYYQWNVNWVEGRMTPIGTLKDGLVIVFRSIEDGHHCGLYTLDIETKQTRRIPIELSYCSAWFPSLLTAFPCPKGATQLTYPEQVQAPADVN